MQRFHNKREANPNSIAKTSRCGNKTVTKGKSCRKKSVIKDDVFSQPTEIPLKKTHQSKMH